MKIVNDTDWSKDAGTVGAVLLQLQRQKEQNMQWKREIKFERV